MSLLRAVARRIRHLPGLEGAEGLWAALRGPYRRLLDSGGRGVLLRVGGTAEARIPAEFSGGSWESYEPEAVAAYSDWLRRHPGGLVLDVGSSIGIYSAVALFAAPAVEVVAFDSDLASLAATRRLCRHASGARLKLVYGFLAQQPAAASSLESAAEATEAELTRVGAKGGAVRYVCLTDAGAPSIPSRRLDDLFASGAADGRPLLIKCDVEGAELLVLFGAEQLLRRARPDLLLSVHPSELQDYGHDRDAVESFLGRMGYRIRCLSVDHEEHWWCEAAPATGERA